MPSSPLPRIDALTTASERDPQVLRPAALSRPSRRFAVHAAHEARAAGHAVEALSFEDAALEFLEAWHPVVDADGEVTLVVTDCETGAEHCLRVDVDTGETASCD